jgi:hypothetical protein
MRTIRARWLWIRACRPVTDRAASRADGIYRFADGGWQKNAGGDNWVPAPDAPPSLLADQRARRAGYNGVVSLMPAAGN